MPRNRLLILIFVQLTILLSFSTSAKTKSSKTTKAVMNEVFQSFINILPYTVNEMKFKDPKSEQYIITNLTRLNNAFKNAKHLKDFNKPGFSPSYEVTKNHLQHTLDAFSTDNKLFARTRLKATTNLCLSCHTQLPKNKKLSSSFKAIRSIDRKNFQTEYEYADFLLLVRDYDKAVKYFKKEISTRIKKNKELKKISYKSHLIDITIEKSIKKIFTIYTKIFFNPKKARAKLGEYIDMPGVPEHMQLNVKGYLETMDGWNKVGFNGKVNNEKALRKYIDTHLSPVEGGGLTSDGSFDIDLLIASGVLYRFLNTNPKTKMKPEILYWLAFSDYQLDYSYFYSLGNIYLKECIVGFKKTKEAKRCFKLYENYIKLGYTGSSGTVIPADEQKELNRLKKML